MEESLFTDLKKLKNKYSKTFSLFFCAILLCTPFLKTKALSLDWTGYSRLDAYYQTKEKRIYGGYQLVLQPTLSALDDLNISGRVEIYTPQSKSLFSPSTADRSFGLPLFYWENGKARKLHFSTLLPEISQIYIDYKTEFFQLQGGRSPRHFGLGVTYNNREDPFSYWISTLDQLFFYTEYGPFYIQPTFITEVEGFLGLFQAGIVMDSWQVDAFYRYNIKKAEHHAEAFAKYGKEKWDLRLSFSYQEAESSAFGLAFEGEARFPWKFKPKIQLKGGIASKNFSFHPAYDVALLFQNYSSKSSKKQLDKDVPTTVMTTEGNYIEGSKLFIQEEVLEDVIYFAPQVEFSFFENFKLSPLFLVAYLNSEKQLNYELDLELTYKLEENFTFALKGGALYSKKWNLGLLSQAAVTF